MEKDYIFKNLTPTQLKTLDSFSIPYSISKIIKENKRKIKSEIAHLKEIIKNLNKINQCNHNWTMVSNSSLIIDGGYISECSKCGGLQNEKESGVWFGRIDKYEKQIKNLIEILNIKENKNNKK